MTNENIYKFENDDGTFIFVIATKYEQAKEKVLNTLKNKNFKFKYCQTGKEYVDKLKQTIERSDNEWLNTKSIVLY